MATREVHGRTVTLETDERVRSWKYVFNCDNQRWGWLGDGQKGAVAAGYPYFIWSGWVYNTKTGMTTGWMAEEVV